VTEQDRMVAGRYRLGEQVGIGAMGIVWRARDERLRRTVAVKQLLLQPGLDEARAAEARLRAMREARIAARLHHPNVVIVYDVAEDDGQPWLVMEYVPSTSLGAALQDGPMAPYPVAAIGAQAAAGLAAAHAVGVVHRDVKPGNVLLGDDGIVKIADFGISRAVDDVVLTATGLLTGTPAYLAPEMAKGEVPAPSSDVFALGATLYAAVEGSPPFGLNENPLALLHLVAAGKVRPPTRSGPLTSVLVDLLRVDPAERPTMREAHDALAAIAAERTMPVRLPPGDKAATRTESTPKPPVTKAPATKPTATKPTATKPTATRPTVAKTPAQARPNRPGQAVRPPARTQVGLPLPAAQALPPRPAKRRSGRLVLVIAVALLAVGAAVVLVNQVGRGSTTAGPGHGATPTTTHPGDTGPPTFTAMSDLITRYYGMLPGDVQDAYQLLSANYRFHHPFASVRGFYAGIASVSPGGFAFVRPNTVRAVITFVTKRGGTSHEPYRFTIVRRHGALAIDDAVLITNGM
jgi:serine/threonine protein kinase